MTGRNFAAGMSGGVAYVLDEEESFESRCNMAQVSLEPVEDEIAARQGSDSGDDLESHGKVDVRHLGMVDEVLLKGLIEKHFKHTGSRQARRILDDWAVSRARFVKVMPHEYRRALTEMAVLKAEKQQMEAV
jgi:glutamate synthase (NADPH/NADH) large chain